jgi:hypothetical protein
MATRLLIFMMLFFVSCERYDKRAPTEFFKITERISDYYAKREYFVLYNPPNDTTLLRKIVEEYNMQTLPIDTIKRYRYVERIFFRETRCLTRNYDEGKPYPTDGIPLREWSFNCSDSKNYPGQNVGNHAYNNEFLMNTCHAIYSHSPDYLYYSYRFRVESAQFSKIKISD